MSEITEISGMAALAICESILLALNDRNILPESEILGILNDAAAGHETAAESGKNKVQHLAVAELIRKIVSAGNSVRRT